MKTLISATLLFLAGLAATPAQIVPPLATTGPGSVNLVPGAPDYAIVQQGPNSRVWARVELVTNTLGVVSMRTNSYVELQTGLAYLNNGQYVESQEIIEGYPGGAIARQGQIQMVFPNDLYSEPIDAQTIAGRFRSAVVCLSYADSSFPTNVLIADVQPCQGEIIVPNQVLYPQAFTNNVNASVRYTYRKSGWEQDVIIDDPGSLPTPESLGLDSTSPTLVLQVITEFLQAPPAQTSPVAIAGQTSLFEDEDVDWGAMRLGQGQALFFGQSTNNNPVPTAKHWVVTPEGRQFLVEEVPFSQLLRPILSRSGGASLDNPARRVQGLASLDRLPKLKPAQPSTRRMELAANSRPERGLLIDYVTMAATATNYFFQGDTTYYISGSVTLLGSNTWEGGTILKFATNGSMVVMRQYNINPQAVFLTQPYRPVIFTAKDDNTVGQGISGSTGYPTNYYAACALSFYGLTSFPTIANLRIAYALQGINSYGIGLTLTNAQFVNCQNGVELTGASLSLRNALFANTQTNFNSASTGTTIDAQNVTFSGSACLISTAPLSTGIALAVTNGLFANVTILNSTNVNLSGGYNGFFNATPFGANTRTNSVNPFKTVGAGAFYLDLTNGSNFRAVGSTNIDPNLLSVLRQKTTYAPIVFSNTLFSVATNLSPQALRNTGTPDLGWHYDPIDYLCSCCVSNATLTLTNGVAVGYFNSAGLWLHNSACLVSTGSPIQRNYLVHYNLVQEQPVSLAGTNGISTAMPINPYHTDSSRNPSVALRFTTLVAPVAAQNVIYTGEGSWDINSFNAQDCEVFGGGTTWSQDGDPAASVITLRNNLFQYANVDVESYAQVTTYNNLFRGTNYYIWFANQGTNAYANTDNAYDGCNSVYLDGTVGHNAYLNGADLISGNGQTSDITTNLAWVTGPLGNYYQSTTSPLIDNGSRTADLAGLYHYTTQTNQVKETNSVVDIGYHYIALGANGLPIDSNGDGIADYIADTNGDGLTETNEIPWNIGIAVQPQSTNVVQGADVSFSVVAAGIGPFTYQWRFNATNIAGATGSTYSKIVVLTNDGGNYSVVLSNGTASVSSSNALLTVFVPLTITNFYPLATNCVQGSNTSFHVQVTGTAPAYQWYQNSTPLTNNSRITGANAADLNISNLNTNDSGGYHAVVTNLAGSVTSQTGYLTVYPPLSLGPLKVSPSPVVQAADTTFSIAASDSSAAFQWLFQSNNIPGATLSNYTRLVMQPSQDAGNYSVTATNLAGPVSASTNITVLVPPLITNQPANVQTNLGATVLFSVGVSTNSTTPLSYRWYFNQTNLITWATNYLATVTLTNLQNTNSGWYSVLLSNLVGTNWSITAFLSLGGSNGLSTNSLQVPNVSMVLPTNTVATNAVVYPYGTPIALRTLATVTDPGSYITQVAFYGGTNLSLSDSNLVGTAVVGANATYAFRYTAPPLGTNWARAVAWDSKGRSNASQTVYYIMNKAPVVTNSPGVIYLVWQGFITNAWFTNYVSDDGYPYRVTNIFWGSTVGVASLTSYTNYTPTNIIITTLATITNYGYGYAVPTLSVSDGNVTSSSPCWIMLQQPPAVQIIRPTNNAVFLAGTPIELDATATPLDGGTSIGSVAFYIGTNLIGNAWPSVGNTFALAWTNAPLWTNAVTAVATDNRGLQGTSPPTNVVVLPYLYVWINSPTNGQVFVTSPTNLLLVASPSNYFRGTCTNVSFYNGSTFLGAGTPQTNSSACQFLWQNVTNGTYTVGVQASDNYGDVATNSVTFTVNAMPMVQITSPTNLARFREVTNITLQAAATDSDGTVSSLQFFFGTNLIPGVVTNNGTNFSLTWNHLTNGAYPITAIATDNRGASTISAIRVFRVATSNLPPSVNLTNPTNGAVFSAGSDLLLQATASSTNGIALVEFFQNGVLLGSDDTPPYQLLVHGLWPGTYQFSAMATDSNGLQSNSPPVNVTVSAWVPLSANGYWDPAFRAFDWSQTYCPNPVPTALGASNEVFAFEWITDSQGDIQSWHSCAWSGMSGLDSLDGPVHSMIASPPNLLLGGKLIFPGQADWVVSTYDGTNLSNLTFNLTDEVYALAFFKGDLIAGGSFTNQDVGFIAKLSGNTWVPMGNALNGDVLAIASIGDDLYIGGDFTSAGGDTNVAYVAKLVGTNWVALGAGVNNPGPNGVFNGSPDGAVAALAVWNGQLVVGGSFTQAGGDTNIAYLAKWDGTTWSPLGNMALSCDDGYYGPAVGALAVHGNDLFVAGMFDSAVGPGGLSLPLGNVAHLQWDPASLTWNWYAMDGGVAIQYSGGHLFAGSLLLRPSSLTNALDVIVGGNFDLAGSICSPQVARWITGGNDCSNYPPSVAFIQPTTAQHISPGDPVYVSANVSAVPPKEIPNCGVSFYANGVWLGYGFTNGTSSYEYDLNYSNSITLQAGSYRLDAVATDNSNLVSKATVFVTVANTNAPGPTVNSDTFYVVSTGAATNLYPLANDSGTGPLRIIGLNTWHNWFGPSPVNSVNIGFGGTYLTCQPAPGTSGTTVITYTVADNVGTNSGIATIIVLAPPTVQITTPTNNFQCGVSNRFTIAGYSQDYSGLTTNISLWLGTNVVASANSTSFSVNWSNSQPGFYTFFAVAKDNNGVTSTSQTVTVCVTNSATSGSGHLPVAAISYPTPTSVNLNGLSIPAPFVVRDGQITNFTGSAYDPDPTDHVAYQVLLLDPQNPNGPPLYNITPAPLNTGQFHDLTAGITNGSLGPLDLSVVDNGTYLLTLVVRGGGDVVQTNVLIGVESNLKIGQFSFSEQDLVLPVNGIPLTVTRTYNSLNPRSGDFGYGWTFALNSMDVALDEERQDVTIGSDQAPFADTEEDSYGRPLVQSIRTGGGWDVTLTLPDGRRTTFAFSAAMDPLNCKAHAQWTAPPDVHATLGLLSQTEGDIVVPALPVLPPYWQSGGAESTLDNHDISGWVLTNLDGTQYFITRGSPNNLYYDTTSGSGNFINVRAYGPPALSEIIQRTGDIITIGPAGIAHYPTNSSPSTRSVFFDRDSQNRITAIHDMISGSNGIPVVQYFYDQNSGNLVQVLKLTDRTAGLYATNRYLYSNLQFPHYITEIDNGLGVPITRNYYDSGGRLISTVDANGNTTQFIHNLTSSLELIADPRGNTNTYAYDSRGNVTAITNAMNGITLMAYDGSNNKTNQVAFLNGQPYATNRYTYDPTSGLLLATVDPLGFTNTFAYNQFGQVTNTVDARGNTSTSFYDGNTGNLLGTSDALGNSTTNSYDGNGLLIGSRDAIGTLTTNHYDQSTGNLTSTATLGSTGTILSTNTFAYDSNGNRTNSTVWRKVGGNWVGAITATSFDGQNRLVQTVNPDGGTSSVVYDAAGRQQSTSDALGHTTWYTFDYLNRLVLTTFQDSTTNASAYDASGNRVSTTDQLGRITTYGYDALNRLTATTNADLSTNGTVYDDLGRVKFTIDARGTTTAFGYDALGRRTAVTNAMGTGVAMSNGFTYDGNGNQLTFTDGLGRTTTNLFDLLNRSIQVWYPDGTRTLTGYDAGGRRTAETNQDVVVTRFGYDGAGRLTAVTNAYGPGQFVTQYQYDEAGNETAQIDALNRTNSFAYDGLGRRISHTLPGGQSESFVYDPAGNLTNYTSFNGVVITNLYDALNRLTNRSAANGYQITFSYWPTGRRMNMVDLSGSTAYLYDSRDRLTNRVETWTAGPSVTLKYRYDGNGNLTNLWSSSSNGVTNVYQYDALNRLTNVIGPTSSLSQYGYDGVGNLQWLRYGNGVTNLYQYDSLNRLTNCVWYTNGVAVASFYYQLASAGNRTNLTETVNSTGRTYQWQYDPLYRLTNENMSASPAGSLGYAYDPVGNRTSRAGTLGLLTAQSFAYGTNDWVKTNAYDSNGNTLWATNGTPVGPYNYDVENHLTNFGSAYFSYNGDGLRVKKVVSGTTNYYLLDDRNPTGYAQALEEWTSTGTPTLSKVYNYGLALISQRIAVAPLSTNYFVFDGHGSTRMLTDSSGIAQNAFAFDAFGNLIASNATPATAYLYCGEQFDSDLGLYYLRARYFNPQMGRFWTMDSYEGGQEDPLTLHKYLYCLANPINNRDPNGHEIEGSLTAMNMDFSLNSFTSIPGASSATAFLWASPYGHGGPDVTATLKRTLNDMGDWFDALKPEDRKHESGRYITGLKAGDSWDIHDLHALEPGEDGINVLSFPGLMPKSRFECGTGLFKATVAVNGEVYYGGAVNYAAYGKMNSLVHDWLKSKSDPVDAAWYSLTATQARVRAFKRFFHFEFSYESGATAEAFTAWGYNGTSLPRGLPTSSSREVVNADKFEWKWMPYHP